MKEKQKKLLSDGDVLYHAMCGLTTEDVEESLRKHGNNELAKKMQKSVFQMFIDSIKEFWTMVLLGTLLVKLTIMAVGIFVPQFAAEMLDVAEAVGIFISICLTTLSGTITEYRNTSRSEALQREYGKTFSKVLRDGKLVSIPTGEIVIGDVILVQAGDKIPADGLIRRGEIKVSQAALNGEPDDDPKTATCKNDEAFSSDFKSMHKAFRGSVVTSGEAYMEAVVIGNQSELGKIALSIAEDTEETLDTSSQKLVSVAKSIGKVGCAAAAVAAGLQMWFVLSHTDGVADVAFYITLIFEAIMLGASIIIMAVPEGLPMVNNLIQSMNTESMYKKNILVSHKAAFADSAYMDVLFSDKTGTITQGNLSLSDFIIGNGIITKGLRHKDCMNAVICTNMAKMSEGKAIGSNNMDRELLNYAASMGMNCENPQEFVKTFKEFNSESKCASAEMQDGIIYWKGATENIIDSIVEYMDADGEAHPFGEEEKNHFLNSLDLMAGHGMKILSTVKITPDDKHILIAALCLRDNVRPDAEETVKTLKKAGIHVIMVTGDAEDTAIAIAKESGIYGKLNDIAITHDQLVHMSDDELKSKLDKLQVVSRAKPLDKKRLVKVAQSMDHVCGMTGDGVNDAPALKQADVGFAMGDGTAVAQEAGDVVILNNSLTSIKDCILNSRTMAKSVGKFLIFQLTVNVSTMAMNILAPILGWVQPFSITQILWINIIMDALAALAFGGEPILDRYMDEPPAKKNNNILTPYINSSIATAAGFITIASIAILENMWGILDYVRPLNAADAGLCDRTFMFAFFIYAVIFNSLNTRSESLNLLEGIWENKRFVVVMGGIFLLQTALLAFGGAVFSTYPPTLRGYFCAAGIAFLIIPIDIARKLVMKCFKRA